VTVTEHEIEKIEVSLLCEAVSRRYGIALRDEYVRAPLTRRLRRFVADEGLASVSALQDRVLREPSCAERLLDALTPTEHGLFYDPGFFRALRRQVLPLLATYPHARIWQVGLSSGVEVFEIAILLEEAGLGERCRVYATASSELPLRRARRGVFPAARLGEWERRYEDAGGTRRFADYATIEGETLVLDPSLIRHTVFSTHHLARDASFNEFNLILCRNVLSNYGRTLERLAHRVLYESLATFGVLGLGDGETLKASPHAASFEELCGPEHLYRRMRR
jgi:chemotaxis protein methyltransferase CheR